MHMKSAMCLLLTVEVLGTGAGVVLGSVLADVFFVHDDKSYVCIYIHISFIYNTYKAQGLTRRLLALHTITHTQTQQHVDRQVT